MKKSLLLFVTPLLFFMANNVQAQEFCFDDYCCDNEMNFYAKILSGANFLQNTSIDGNKAKYQTGYIISGSLGYTWCYGLSLEFEYAFRRNAIKKIEFFTEGSSNNGYLQTSSCMANLLWDLPLSCWECQPFIGVGVGYDFQKMHSSNSRVIFNQKWNQVSWQAMAGLTYPIFCNTEVSLEYKFHMGKSHFYNHTIGVGLAYNFDWKR